MNRFNALALVVLVSICALLPTANAVAAQPMQIVSSLPQDSGTVYTILALPSTYKTCYHCMELDKAFNADPDLLHLRQETKYVRLIGNSAAFRDGWGRYLPEVEGQGKTMVLQVRQVGDKIQILQKLSAPSVDDVKCYCLDSKIFAKLKERFCPKCQPQAETPAPEATPAPMPATPVIPDTKPEDVKADDKPDQTQAVLCLGVLAAGTWYFLFKHPR